MTKSVQLVLFDLATLETAKTIVNPLPKSRAMNGFARVVPLVVGIMILALSARLRPVARVIG